jgi:hypothetical protein
MRKRCKRSYKKQGGVQVSDIFRHHVIVVFVSNFLVDGPKVCDWVGLDPSGFPVRDCPLQPKSRQLIQSEKAH